ncbi:MAG TPA: histidine phosphatase family protein [Burkholderiales bacterium]
MGVARLCMVRHGETAWNAARRIQGQLDLPLSDAGREQARCVSRALPQGRFAALYASDLLRVRQTAEPAAERHGLRPRLEPALRERHYGSFQSLTFDEVKAARPEDYARYLARDPEFDFGGGESLRDFSSRALACLSAIAERHAGEEVLVFTHGGVLEMAYRRAKGLDLSAPRDFETPNCALNWVEAGASWQVLGWAECGHLQ